jgi:hypothetical protein
MSANTPKPHPLATIFPLLEGDEFDALAASVKARGGRNAITLCQGMILDGRNRARACEAASVKSFFDVYEGHDPVGFALDQNRDRGHLNAAQLAMAPTSWRR